jgi:hypothetical protein
MLGLELEIKNLVEYDITKPMAYVLMAFLRFLRLLVVSKSSVTLSGVEVPRASKVKFRQQNFKHRLSLASTPHSLTRFLA